jgi:hypothetical protein
MVNYPYGKPWEAKVSDAIRREAVIAPALCECGALLSWESVRSNGVLLWEHAMCGECEILWVVRYRRELITPSVS